MTSLRPPLEHVLSHMLEVGESYSRCALPPLPLRLPAWELPWDRAVGTLLTEHALCCRSWAERLAPPELRSWRPPPDLGFWQRLAPAVLDNYYVRTLLGRHFMCLPFGAVDAAHARHAAAKLLSFDIVLDLQQEAEQHSALVRLGLGWGGSLARTHERAGDGRIERLGLQPRQVLPLLERVNVHDSAVYRHGAAIAELDARFFVQTARLVSELLAGGPRAGDARRLRRLDAAGVAALAAAWEEQRPCGLVGLQKQRAA
jgi:hypothetical protein